VTTQAQRDTDFLAYVREEVADGAKNKVFTVMFVADIMAAVDRVIAERDEARREVCCLFESSIAYSVKTGMIGFANPEHESLLKHARTRGWDCFKEDAK
jgi:thymidylate kinase